MKWYWKIICWTCLGTTAIEATTLATVFAFQNKYQQNSNISNLLATAIVPDVTSWYMPIIGSIGLVADILNYSVYIATIFISQTISQLQKEITKLEDNARD